MTEMIPGNPKTLLFLIAAVLLSILSCSKNGPYVPRSSEPAPNTIFGRYNSPPDGFGGAMIILYNDSSYYYAGGACVESGSDSGKYRMNIDTIYLRSLVEDKVDTTNTGHGQIWPQTGRKLLYDSGRIYHYLEKGKFANDAFWLREDLETMPAEVLDSTGSGYATTYYGDRRITQRGEFRRFKLYEGEARFYNSDKSLARIEIYEQGKKIKDSIPKWDN